MMAQARTLLLSEKYQLLKAVGLTYWLPKRGTSVLVSDQPIFCAACLVILPTALKYLESDIRHMLNGMLKVLSVSSTMLSIAWIRENINISDSSTLIQQAIIQWAPRQVLVMGEELAKTILNLDIPFDTVRENNHVMPGSDIPLQVTYHPNALKAFPDNKKKAYQDLLSLKQQIEGEQAT
jgi:hypothetical protein